MYPRPVIKKPPRSDIPDQGSPRQVFLAPLLVLKTSEVWGDTQLFLPSRRGGNSQQPTHFDCHLADARCPLNELNSPGIKTSEV